MTELGFKRGDGPIDLVGGRYIADADT